MTHRYHRRSVIVAGIAAVAGCVGDDENDDDSEQSRREGPTVGELELDSSFPMTLEDPETGEELADVHYHDDGGSHWHHQPMEVPLGEERTYVVVIYDADIERVAVADDPDLELQYLEDEESPDVISADIDGDELTVIGDSIGEAEPRLELHGPDDSWVTPTMIFAVDEAE